MFTAIFLNMSGFLAGIELTAFAKSPTVAVPHMLVFSGEMLLFEWRRIVFGIYAEL